RRRSTRRCCERLPRPGLLPNEVETEDKHQVEQVADVALGDDGELCCAVDAAANEHARSLIAERGLARGKAPRPMLEHPIFEAAQRFLAERPLLLLADLEHALAFLTRA